MPRRKIITIHNDPPETTGNGRERSVYKWSRELGAEAWVVQGGFYSGSPLSKMLAVPRLLLRLWKQPGAIIIMFSPSFPFFWDLNSSSRLLRAIMFALAYKVVSVLRRQIVVIDILDLIRLQHVDLKYPVNLPKWLFKFFDRCTYHLSTELWVCSEAIADHIKSEMFWGRDRAKTVLNGSWPTEYDKDGYDPSRRPQVFMYAGHASRERGIPMLIDEFARCKRQDVELRICGREGEWIPGCIKDNRITYLGNLNQSDAARELAKCDVAIIFQPDGFYYDMVYPGKFPFYVARGMPILATNNRELYRVVNETGVGVSVPIDKIAETIDNMTGAEAAVCASNSVRLRPMVMWNAIYDDALGNLLKRIDGENPLRERERDKVEQLNK